MEVTDADYEQYGDSAQDQMNDEAEEAEQEADEEDDEGSGVGSAEGTEPDDGDKLMVRAVAWGGSGKRPAPRCAALCRAVPRCAARRTPSFLTHLPTLCTCAPPPRTGHRKSERGQTQDQEASRRSRRPHLRRRRR